MPTTPVLDTFTDGSAPRDLTVYDPAHWGGKTIGADSLARTATSNLCGSTAAAAESSCYWSGVNAADVEVFATVTTKPANGAFLELSARIQNPGGGSETAYHLAIFPVAGTDTWELWKHIAGSGSQISVVSTTELNAGDVVSMRIVGNKISFYQNGVQLGSTVTDNSISGNGFIGLRYSDNTTRLDNFGGGSIASSSSYAYDEASMYQLLGQPGAAVFTGYVDGGPNTVVGGTTFPQDLTANDVVITATLTKVVNKVLAATSTITSSLVKTVLKNLSATSTSTASLIKQVAKNLTATSTTTATLTKLVQKPLSATSTITASLLTQKVILVALNATTTITASLTKLVSKNLTANVGITPSLTKLVLKALFTVSTTGLFRQWLDAFDSTTTESGCTIVVDPASMQATVVATIASASDTNDQATANITAGGKLPAVNEGRIRFYVKTPSTFNPTNNITLLDVRNSLGHEIVNLYLDSAETLKAFSQATDLSTAGFNSSSGMVLAANTEYLIEISYKQNSNFTLWVNGVQKINNTGLTGGTVGRAVATDVRVGIDHYDGADSNPQGPYTYREFQLSDDSTTALTGIGTVTNTITATLLAQKVILVALNAVTTITATLTKRVNLNLNATTTITPSLTKLVSKTLSASSTITASLVTQFIAAGGAGVARLRRMMGLGQ